MFSLRTLMFVTASVAACLAAQKMFVYNHTGELWITVARAKLVPEVIAAATAIYACMHPRRSDSKHRSMISRGAMFGGIAGFLTATLLGIGIAESVRRFYPEYWDWTRNIVEFVIVITYLTVVSVIVGAATSALYCAFRIVVKRIGLTRL
ncbi:MAG: hypothetical protein KDA59_08085 [Planctomycetales bacterium]|nr:hypothetical protein [Planctomycetales bacterium]